MSIPENDPNRPANPGQAGEPENQPQYGQQAPQYGQQAPQYGQQAPGAAPQYGQNLPQHGQSPSGQQGQSPYGYQQGQAAGYNYPGQASAGAPRTAPKEVVTAFWLILAAGALYLIAAILGAINPAAQLPPGQMDQLMELSGGAMDREAFLAMYGTSVLITGIIVTGLYVLMAFMVKKGKNWARITATVFAVLSLVGIFSGPLPALYVLLGVAAVVMLWLKPSNAYFKPQPRGF
jgi:hypothetical protein